MTMPIVHDVLSAVWHVSYSGLVSPYFVLFYSCFHSFILSVGLSVPSKDPWISEFLYLLAPTISFSSLKQQLSGSPPGCFGDLHHYHHHRHSHYHQQTSLVEASNSSSSSSAA